MLFSTHLLFIFHSPLQATPEMLLQHLVEESVDDTFHKDFLLTYRTFLKDPLPLIDKLKEAWQSGLPDQRERVKVKCYVFRDGDKSLLSLSLPPSLLRL